MLADSTRRGGWGSREIKVIESLLPHLRYFVRVRHALLGAQTLNTSLARLLDDRRLGVIQLDRGGRIVETNDYARGLLLRGHGVFDQDGSLHARVPADNARLQELVAHALPGFRSPVAGDSITVLRWPARSRLVVHVLPVGNRQKDFGIGGVAVLVLLVEPGRPAQLDAELVASALGLTETESQVAVALAIGKTASDMAQERGLKVSTVRFHINRIYTKLGLSRQTDLIRLVLPPADVPGPLHQ